MTALWVRKKKQVVIHSDLLVATRDTMFDIEDALISTHLAVLIFEGQLCFGRSKTPCP